MVSTLEMRINEGHNNKLIINTVVKKNQKYNGGMNLLFMLRREPVERREFLSLGGKIEIKLKQRHSMLYDVH